MSKKKFIVREKGHNPWEVYKRYTKESRISFFFFFLKKKRNLDKVEKRKIITGSKCRVHLHTDSANLESNIEEEEATVPTTSS